MRTLSFVCLIALTLLTGPLFGQQLSNFRMGPGYAGDLRVGMRADQAVTIFGNNRVREVDLYLEGPAPIRALEVRLGDVKAAQPSLLVRFDPEESGPIVLKEKRVGGIKVYDRRFRTADGLGIGSTLQQISARHRVAIGYGEGSLGAEVKDLAMTFDFTAYYSTGRVPPSARAESVWIWP